MIRASEIKYWISRSIVRIIGIRSRAFNGPGSAGFVGISSAVMPWLANFLVNFSACTLMPP